MCLKTSLDVVSVVTHVALWAKLDCSACTCHHCCCCCCRPPLPLLLPRLLPPLLPQTHTHARAHTQPVHLHGSLGREAATGRGTVFAIREMLRHVHEGKIQDHTFVIQVGGGLCVLGGVRGHMLCVALVRGEEVKTRGSGVCMCGGHVEGVWGGGVGVVTCAPACCGLLRVVGHLESCCCCCRALATWVPGLPTS